jgi:nucleoid DNA-binding protein
MIQYLLQILENNNRVIVPEFGAFIIKHRDPLTIVFNEFLQYNDGQLINIVSKQEKIDREQAKKKLDEFVTNINESLNSGNNYPLGQLGILTKSATGRISLEEAGSIDQPKLIKKIPDIEIKKEKEIVEPLESPAKEDKPTVEKKKTRPEVKQKPETAPIVPEKVSADEKIEKEPKPVQTETNKVIAPIKIIPKEAEYKSQNGVTKNRKINIIAWIVVILFVNGIIIAYFLTSENFGNFLLKEQSKKEIIKIEKPVVTKKVAPAEAPIKTSEQVMAAIEDSVKKVVREKVSVEKKPASGKRFYIVAGVFSSEQNAKKLVKELKLKGYNSENFGKIGSLYAVSYDVLSSKEEADKILSKIKKAYDPKAWIKVIE